MNKELLDDHIPVSQITYTLTLNKFNNRESETLMKRIDKILAVIESEIK